MLGVIHFKAMPPEFQDEHNPYLGIEYIEADKKMSIDSLQF
jgi:hypothetical protein